MLLAVWRSRKFDGARYVTLILVFHVFNLFSLSVVADISNYISEKFETCEFLLIFFV